MNLAMSRTSTNAIISVMSANPQSLESSNGLQLAALIELMAAGDEVALGRLYDLTLPRVFGLAMKITGRRELAEEVCIETFWQSWREAGRYDALRGEPLAWLMVMTRSRALDALRKLDRTSYCAEPEIYLETELCPSATPLERVLQEERANALRSALGALSPTQRQLIALAFYKDLTHQEICDQTGLPLGTVKSHLKRAQECLRTVLCQA